MLAYLGRWEDREVEGFTRAVEDRFETEDVALVPTRGDISKQEGWRRRDARVLIPFVELMT